MTVCSRFAKEVGLSGELFLRSSGLKGWLVYTGVHLPGKGQPFIGAKVASDVMWKSGWQQYRFCLYKQPKVADKSGPSAKLVPVVSRCFDCWGLRFPIPVLCGVATNRSGFWAALRSELWFPSTPPTKRYASMIPIVVLSILSIFDYIRSHNSHNVLCFWYMKQLVFESELMLQSFYVNKNKAWTEASM